MPCDVTHMDVNVLQKLVEDDVSSGKTPTIVVAYAGNVYSCVVVTQSHWKLSALLPVLLGVAIC